VNYLDDSGIVASSADLPGGPFYNNADQNDRIGLGAGYHAVDLVSGQGISSVNAQVILQFFYLPDAQSVRQAAARGDPPPQPFCGTFYADLRSGTAAPVPGYANTCR